MKHARLLALFALTASPLFSLARQEEEKPVQEPLGGVFAGQAESLTKAIEGSWMLMEYVDPDEIPLEDAASGFMTFRAGFLTWILSVEALEKRWFTVDDRVFLQTGAYRYRFDETASLQLASVLSFSNDTDDGKLQRDPALAFEYTVTLTDDLLELSDPNGVRMTYRRVESGEFPLNAIQKIERGRSRTPSWGDEER